MEEIGEPPPNLFKKSDHNFQSIKILLKSIVTDNNFLDKIRNVVFKANKIRNDAYLFIKSYLLHCYENNIEFPKINKQFVSTIIKVMGVSKAKKELLKDIQTNYDILNKFYNEIFIRIYPHEKNNRYLMQYVENYMINEIIKNIETNLKTHYNERLKKYIKIFGGRVYDELNLPQNNKRRIIGKLVKNILFQEFDQIDEIFQVWFEHNCKKLTKVYSCPFKIKIQTYLKCTFDIAHKFEQLNNNLDRRMNELKNEESYFKYNQVKDEIDNGKKQLILLKKDKKNKKEISKLTKIIKNKQRERNKYSNESQFIKLSSQKIALFNVTPLPNFNLNHVLFDSFALNDLFSIRNKRYLRDRVTTNPDEIWSQFFNLDNQIFKTHSNFQFDYMINTDGVSCSLLFRKIGLSKGYTVNLPEENEYEFPKIEDLTPDQINSYNQIVACDPGKKYLGYFGAEEIEYFPDEAGPNPNYDFLKYSNKQRIAETKSNKCRKIMEKEKTNEVKLAEQELNLCCSKTVNFEEFKRYLITRHRHYKVLTDFYQLKLWQKWRFRKFSNKQRSEDNLLNRIEKKFDKNILIVLGDWSQSNKLKNGSPTLGVGLRKLLSKRFHVALINEHNTSKLCCDCHHPVSDVKINGNKVFRLLGCKNCNLNKNNTSEPPVKEKVYSNYKYTNRDKNSVKNMLYIVSEMVNNGMQRPEAFNRTLS